MLSIGQTAIIGMISHVMFIYFTWRLLQAVNLGPLLKKGRVSEANILLMFISIAVGAGVSRFFLDILRWSQDVVYLF